MRISLDGKLSLLATFIFAMGAGALAVFPHAQIIGWATMAVAALGLIALGFHQMFARGGGEDRTGVTNTGVTNEGHYAGRDNAGTQQIFQGPVTIHHGSSPKGDPEFEGQKIIISLPPDAANVALSPTTNPTVISKWVHVAITVGDGSYLTACQVYLKEVRRVLNFQLGSNLVDSDINLQWANHDSAIERDIRQGVTALLDVFAIYKEGNRTQVAPCTSPIKFTLRDGIQEPGTYRFSIVATAHGVEPKEATFDWIWNDFDHVSVTHA